MLRFQSVASERGSWQLRRLATSDAASSAQRERAAIRHPMHYNVEKAVIAGIPAKVCFV